MKYFLVHKIPFVSYYVCIFKGDTFKRTRLKIKDLHCKQIYKFLQYLLYKHKILILKSHLQDYLQNEIKRTDYNNIITYHFKLHFLFQKCPFKYNTQYISVIYENETVYYKIYNTLNVCIESDYFRREDKYKASLYTR